MLLVANTILAESLDKLLELAKLGNKRRLLRTIEVLIGVFLKSGSQSVRLICLEIYRPARRLGADLFFYMIPYLIFSGVALKGAQPPRDLYRVQAAVVSRELFQTVASDFW